VGKKPEPKKPKEERRGDEMESNHPTLRRNYQTGLSGIRSSAGGWEKEGVTLS